MRTASLALLVCSGCIAGGTMVVHGNPAAGDDRVMRQVMRQDLWAQQALDARPNPKQLDRIRSGDPASIDRGRHELTKLLQAVDRGTWIRDTVSEVMRQDEDPRLAQEFDRAGRLRADSLKASGELADALIDGGAGLTMADLRPGFDGVRKAQASEDRLAKLPVGPNYPQLAPSPLPMPSPLDAAAAKLAGGSPDSVAQLPPDEATRIRARAADMDRQKEEQQRIAISNLPAEPPMTGAPTEAAGPQTTLTIANDALDIITRKRPRSITLREDGLFDLSCADGEYLVGPDGKLVRKDPPAP